MPNTLMLVPANHKAELDKLSLALERALQTAGFKTAYLQPINQKPKKNSKLAKRTDLSQPIDIRYAEYLLSKGWSNAIVEEIVMRYNTIMENADVVVVQGLAYLPHQHYIAKLNAEIANALQAKIIILANGKKKNSAGLEKKIRIAAHNYHKKNILGCVIDKSGISSAFSPSGIKCISHIPAKKRPKILKNSIINFMTKQFDGEYIKGIATLPCSNSLSPTLFRHHLIKRANAAYKKIVLPEANDVRVLQAAQICTKRKIADCILMGNADEIYQFARENGLKLSRNIKIIEPTAKMIDRYVKPLVALRKHKGLTPEQAKENLQDYVVLATMMLQQGEIDGVVAGAQHTSAHTVRPALQLIKSRPNTKAVSSVFFMCLPKQVMLFADCAVTLNPTAEELADIAIQTVETATLFGIKPRIAMLSYSTHDSGHGITVDKVVAATNMVKDRRPNLIIDGPLQYDAAVHEEIAKIKAPNSPIAGQASICIFPDLDSGNIVYKAVQRSANIPSFGPIIQGLRRPVNDLSRGSSVEDIVFTIAVTAVQAANLPS